MHDSDLHLDMRMVGGDRDELRETLAEPHGYVSLHVDGEGFESFLQATDGEELQAANILAQVNPTHLREA